jgi:hypothetical protein
VDIRTSGDDACKEGVEQFLPDFYNDQVENGRYSLINIPSDNETKSERESVREDLIDNGDISEQSAIFTVTRFLVSESTLDDPWNPEQPCILYIDE